MTMLEMRNRVKPQLDQFSLIHGAMVETSKMLQSKTDLHVMETVVTMLGMARKESGYSTLLIIPRKVYMYREV